MRISKQGKVFGFKAGNKVNLGRIHKNKYPPNTYFKDFLMRMETDKRRNWLKEFGNKIRLSIVNDKNYMEKLRLRMIDNTYYTDWKAKNYPEQFKVYEMPSYNKSIVDFTGTPKFNPLINGRVKFLKFGLSTRKELAEPPTYTF